MPTSPSLASVRDIFRAMQTEQINGHPLSDVVGGGDPELVAAEVVAAIVKYAELNPGGDSILDVGCGCGRIAAALTQYVDSKSHYTGIDIVPGLIDFGRKFITPRFPRFKFLLSNESNRTYDAWRPEGGEIGIAKLAEAVAPQSIDLAISISLFTHLDFAPAVEMLTSIYHALKNGGRAFVTVFVLDAEAASRIEGGRAAFSFKHRTPTGELFAEKSDDPTFAVAFDGDLLTKLVRSANLRLERHIRGYWSTGGPGEIFQDVLILRKA
ncbi:MAG TPA: class I SAM-dependent methyltransferase [Chthoniobacterales bacterium]|nr:class I SAM-dependent methyltransferase [Chthoniobacterales bacterium]